MQGAVQQTTCTDHDETESEEERRSHGEANDKEGRTRIRRHGDEYDRIGERKPAKGI
jgi:hypothetical protein